MDHLSLKLGNDSELQLIATEDGRYSFKTTLTGPLTLSPILTSKDGLKNERPPSCRITVYRDRAPSVKITTPDDEIAVRADDKVTVEFAAKDDFGITKAELVVFEGHGEDARELKAVEIPLGEQQGTESIQGERYDRLRLSSGVPMISSGPSRSTNNGSASIFPLTAGPPLTLENDTKGSIFGVPAISPLMLPQIVQLVIVDCEIESYIPPPESKALLSLKLQLTISAGHNQLNIPPP